MRKRRRANEEWGKRGEGGFILSYWEDLFIKKINLYINKKKSIWQNMKIKLKNNKIINKKNNTINIYQIRYRY